VQTSGHELIDKLQKLFHGKILISSDLNFPFLSFQKLFYTLIFRKDLLNFFYHTTHIGDEGDHYFSVISAGVEASMVSKSKKKSNVHVHNEVKTLHMHTANTSDISPEKSVEQLIQELKEGNDEIVRSSAAGALGHIKSEKAVEPLIRALKDTHVYVRHGAAWALGEIKSEKAIEALRQALNDEDEVTRGKAAEALWKIQGS
jgi:hypothetical protein